MHRCWGQSQSGAGTAGSSCRTCIHVLQLVRANHPGQKEKGAGDCCCAPLQQHKTTWDCSSIRLWQYCGAPSIHSSSSHHGTCYSSIQLLMTLRITFHCFQFKFFSDCSSLQLQLLPPPPPSRSCRRARISICLKNSRTPLPSSLFYRAKAHPCRYPPPPPPPSPQWT